MRKGKGQPDLQVALIGAVRAGDLEAARRVVRAGADPNAPDAEGQHPLEAAAWTGNGPMAQLLLELGAAAGSKQHAAVVVAAQRGHADVLRQLLGGGADPNQPDEEGCLALCQAATGGHLEAVQLLVGAGADPRAVDADENSPLRGAALRSHWAIVEVLLPLSTAADQKEARQLRDRFLQRVAKDAAASRARDAAAVAMASRPGVAATPYASVREAVAAGAVAAVGKLLAAGTDVNEPDPKTGRTALMLAAERGDEPLVRRLIEAGADAGAQDRNLTSPILLAARGGHLGTVQLLADAGADPRARQLGGDSPVLAAAKHGHWAILDFLGPRSLAADRAQAITLRTIARQGASAEVALRLTGAARAGDRVAVERLLAEGVPVDAVNPSGYTALMEAAGGGHVELVRLLLDRGANPRLTDNYGDSALNRATGADDTAAFTLLWPLASPKQRATAMKQVAFNRMLPAQRPNWKDYEPPGLRGRSAGPKAKRPGKRPPNRKPKRS